MSGPNAEGLRPPYGLPLHTAEDIDRALGVQAPAVVMFEVVVEHYPSGQFTAGVLAARSSVTQWYSEGVVAPGDVAALHAAVAGQLAEDRWQVVGGWRQSDGVYRAAVTRRAVGRAPVVARDEASPRTRPPRAPGGSGGAPTG